ncbi:MAG: SUMF1/EgtB/PvdO family nonheme iron enzyme, partial [Nannocystaceae bacterium]
MPIVRSIARGNTAFRLDIRHNGLNLYVGGKRLQPLEGCPKDGPTLCLDKGPYTSELATPVMSTSVADLLASYNPTRLAGHLGTPNGQPALLQVDVGDEFPVAFVVATLDALGAFTGENPPTLTLPLDFAPCLTAPEGMVCVPGGPAIVGNDRGPAEEKPRRELVLSTFYIDKLEVTIADFDQCSEAGACKRRINGHQNIMKPFVEPNKPVVPIDWPRANAYCAYRGKRLPTEWEWEKAARGPDGDIYPWGNGEPTCELAQYRECAPFGCTPYPGFTNRWDCPVHDTKDVGSFPAGHYGIHEMAGNGYEWTSSAGVDAIATCGDACNGTDPLGACDGAYPCEGTRMLRGGSWWWPKGRIRGPHRRVEKVQTHGHRLSARCVTTTPVRTSYPPAHVNETRPEPSGIKPLTDEQRTILATVKSDAIEDKHICSTKVREEWGDSLKEGGRSTTECRDPYPYIMPNEPRGHIWRAFFKNLGGAYLGVGSDQNYNYIAHARSSFAWVMDYDPRVVRQHLRLRAFILHSETPEAFVARFAPENARSSAQLLREVYKDHPKKAAIANGYTRSRGKLHTYFQGQQKSLKAAANFGWLRVPENYAYIKKLYTQGRLNVLAGDLLGTKAISTASAAAEALGQPIRIY